MPFDIGFHFGKCSNYVAKHTIIGKVILNPIWFSLLIVFCLLLIIYTIGVSEKPTFKLVFYMFTFIIIAMVAHDSLTKQIYHEKYEETAGTDLVNEVNTMNTLYNSNVAPRTVQQATESLLYREPPKDADDLLDLIDS